MLKEAKDCQGRVALNPRFNVFLWSWSTGPYPGGGYCEHVGVGGGQIKSPVMGEVACAIWFARHIKTIWKSGIPDDVSNTTPESKNDLKGLLR
jgi:hypothetical protein